MAATTVVRQTEKRKSPYDWPLMNLIVGTKVLHGTIGALDSAGKVAPPAAGKRPMGRVNCPDNVESDVGERCQIDQGIHCWEAEGSITIAHLGEIVYAKDNQTVSRDPGDGEPFGVIVDVTSQGVWVLSGFGVGTLREAELIET